MILVFDIEDGKFAVKMARQIIEDYLNDKDPPKFKLPDKSKKKSGVFVTLHTFPKNDLRGCIGFPEPHFKLFQAITDAAVAAATRDPRFPQVKASEMKKLVVEVSLLTPPEPIKVKDPKEYLKKVKIGRDGLIVEKAFFRGLLLPQVPVEWEWDVETFLQHTCNKAGLPAEAWREKSVKFYSFQAKVFSEKEPYGEIVEKM
jgi:uncharacterized protein (TIGR00296 family)